MIRVAVIGVGNMGYHHARHYNSFDQVKLAGVVDPDKVRGKEVAQKLNTTYYSSIDELVTNEHIDAVSIAVPTHLHYQVMKKAVKHIKHILLEKPIANTPSDAKKIAYLIKRHHTQVMIGYLERYNPAIQAVKKLIDTRELGEILSIIIKRVGMYPPTIKHADVITDLATHDIDILNYLFNNTPRIITAVGGSLIENTYDYSEILLQYGSVHCYLQTNWVTPVKIRTMTITGSKGYAEINYITQEVKVYEANVQKQFSDFGEFVLRIGKPTHRELDIKKEEPLKQELLSFIQALDNKGSIVSYEDGLRALETAHKIKQRIKRKK